MKLIVGLGNPGQEYENTRHNVGFRCIDAYAMHQQISEGLSINKKLHAAIAKNSDTIIAKPVTYMNESGRAVQAIIEYYKIDKGEICVVHDDIDIELGAIKIQTGGTSAGHNGIKSIIQNIGTEDFIRIRVGVGKPPKEYGIDTADYVLGNFTTEQEKTITQTINKVSEVLQFMNSHDLVATMNKYN